LSSIGDGFQVIPAPFSQGLADRSRHVHHGLATDLHIQLIHLQGEL
jgi:hypothetical protein